MYLAKPLGNLLIFGTLVAMVLIWVSRTSVPESTRTYFETPNNDTVSLLSWRKDSPYKIGEHDSLGIDLYGAFSFREQPKRLSYAKVSVVVIKTTKERI